MHIVVVAEENVVRVVKPLVLKKVKMANLSTFNNAGEFLGSMEVLNNVDRIICLFDTSIVNSGYIINFHETISNTYLQARVIIAVKEDKLVAEELTRHIVSPYTAVISVSRLNTAVFLEWATLDINAIKSKYGLHLEEDTLTVETVSEETATPNKNKNGKPKKKRKLFGIFGGKENNEDKSKDSESGDTNTPTLEDITGVPSYVPTYQQNGFPTTPETSTKSENKETINTKAELPSNDLSKLMQIPITAPERAESTIEENKNTEKEINLGALEDEYDLDLDIDNAEIHETVETPKEIPRQEESINEQRNQSITQNTNTVPVERKETTSDHSRININQEGVATPPYAHNLQPISNPIQSMPLPNPVNTFGVQDNTLNEQTKVLNDLNDKVEKLSQQLQENNSVQDQEGLGNTKTEGGIPIVPPISQEKPQVEEQKPPIQPEILKPFEGVAKVEEKTISIPEVTLEIPSTKIPELTIPPVTKASEPSIVQAIVTPTPLAVSNLLEETRKEDKLPQMSEQPDKTIEALKEGLTGSIDDVAKGVSNLAPKLGEIHIQKPIEEVQRNNNVSVAKNLNIPASGDLFAEEKKDSTQQQVPRIIEQESVVEEVKEVSTTQEDTHILDTTKIIKERVNSKMFFIVTGDRYTGKTTSAVSLAKIKGKTKSTLLVDFDDRKGLLLLLGIDTMMDRIGDVQSEGVSRLRKPDILPHLAVPTPLTGVECLVTNFQYSLEDEAINKAQSVLLNQYNYEVVIIDCPMDKLHLLKDIIPFSMVLVCVTPSVQVLYNTFYNLEEIAKKDSTLAKQMSLSMEYLLVNSTDGADFQQSLDYLDDYFESETLDWWDMRVSLVQYMGEYFK